MGPHPSYACASALCLPMHNEVPIVTQRLDPAQNFEGDHSGNGSCPGLPHELFQHLVGLGAHHTSVTARKRWDAGDTFPARLRPIRIDRFLKTPILQHVTCARGRKPNRLGDIEENREVSDVATLRKVRAIDGVVNGFGAGLSLGPLAELLGEATVVGVRSRDVRQSFGIQKPVETRVNRSQVASGEQIGERKSLSRRLRMKREMHQLHVDFKILLQFLNTPGT